MEEVGTLPWINLIVIGHRPLPLGLNAVDVIPQVTRLLGNLDSQTLVLHAHEMQFGQGLALGRNLEGVGVARTVVAIFERRKVHASIGRVIRLIFLRATNGFRI